ncbi:MAG: hypothetical protein AAGA01_19030, partial [Cyanobacteria bacterium P01_E01_bin.43]
NITFFDDKSCKTLIFDNWENTQKEPVIHRSETVAQDNFGWTTYPRSGSRVHPGCVLTQLVEDSASIAVDRDFSSGVYSSAT